MAWSKRIIAAGLAVSLVLIGGLVWIKRDSFGERTKQTDKTKTNEVSDFYLFPPRSLYGDPADRHILLPENTEMTRNKDTLLEDINQNKLFHREEEIIQMEINRLPH